MSKRLFLSLLSLLCITPLAQAGSIQEDEQDRLYVQCLAKRRVDPKNIPKEDNTFCMNEAGIEDPGDAKRKEKGEAWRGCIIQKAVELDDGISPVTDIAKAIIVLCPNEWREYVGSLAMYPRAKRRMANGIEQYAVDEGVQAVLRTRRVKREMQTPSESKKK